MNQKPLCIDSQVVEKIDRIESRGTETVFRCALNKVVPYSTFFGENLNDIRFRLQKLERLLGHLGQVKGKIIVTILATSSGDFLVSGHHVYLSQDVFQMTGQLEKAIAKIWYRERMPERFVDSILIEEFITDIILYLNDGLDDIFNRATEQKISFSAPEWPYNLSYSAKDYCRSGWQRSEDLNKCKSSQSLTSIDPSHVIRMSQRQLLIFSWIEGYRSLTPKEKFEVIGLIGSALERYFPSYAQFDLGLEMVAEKNTFQKAAFSIFKVIEFWRGLGLTVSSYSFTKLQEAFEWQLNMLGIKNFNKPIYFDFVIESLNLLDENSEQFLEFKKIAKAHSQIHFAVQDSENFWFFPTGNKISKQGMGEIKAHNYVMEKCGHYDFNYVLSFYNKADRLLILNRCTNHDEVKYKRLFAEGIEGFAAHNRKITFVQFHLPSVQLRRNELKGVTDVSKFLFKKDKNNISFKSLGWVDIEEHKIAKAFQPKASVDAVEWYRIESAQ